MAFDGGRMDRFPATVAPTTGTSPTGQPCKSSDVMNYYDGRTVTGMWNYAGSAGASTPRLADQNGRCGYGPRLPFLLISPWAKHDYVSHKLTDFSSIIKFVEDNWGLPRIPGSYDAITGSIKPMFNFAQARSSRLFLDPTTGQPTTGWR